MTISNRMRVTMKAAVVCGLIAHLFALTNIVQNGDNVIVNGYGAGIISGRWFLSVLGDFVGKVWGNYNLPFFNGILTIIFLSIAAGVVTEIFNIKSNVLCAIWGGLFLCFPTVTSALFYRFTTPYYAVAILLTICSVWCIQKRKKFIILAPVLSACALGIYQAFYPMMATMLVLLLIQKILQPDSDVKEIVKEGFLYLGILLTTLIVYFCCLKICLELYNVSLTSYQEINDMGRLSLKELPRLFGSAYLNFFRLLIDDYCGISATLILRIVFWFLGIVSVLMIVWYLYITRRDLKIIASTIALCLLFPLALNSIIIMCPNSEIYTLMVYASVFIFLMPMLLLDLLGESRDFVKISYFTIIRKSSILVLTIAIINYIWLSNGNYTSMYYTTRQTENYYNSLVTQVKMTEGYNPFMPWVFVGDKINDPLFVNPWQEKFNYGGNFKELINEYSRFQFLELYLGYKIPFVSEEEKASLEKDPFVREMPCYPSDGSITVYQDKVVIKFSNEE